MLFPFNTDLFRVDFNPKLFEKLISTHGKRMIWSKRTFCPNRIDNDPNRHPADCTVCDMSGFVYYDPQEIRAVAQSIPMQHVFRAEGRFQLGTMIVTTSSTVQIDLWDKLVMVLSISRESEVLIRNSVSNTDRPKYDILNVLRVMSAERIFNLGTDFKLVNGQIQWLPGGNQPAVGENYSIDYTFHPTYLVREFTNEFRDALTRQFPTATQEDFNQLPKRMLCGKLHQVRDESQDVRE